MKIIIIIIQTAVKTQNFDCKGLFSLKVLLLEMFLILSSSCSLSGINGNSQKYCVYVIKNLLCVRHIMKLILKNLEIVYFKDLICVVSIN